MAIMLCSLLGVQVMAQRSAFKDSDLTKALVGTWIVNKKSATAEVNGEVTLHSNGKFSVVAKIRINGIERPMSYSGKWSVQNGFLIEKITKHSIPERNGRSTKDQVVEVNDQIFTYRTQHGELEMRKRKPSDKRESRSNGD